VHAVALACFLITAGVWASSAEGIAATHDATLRNTSFTVRFTRFREVNGELTVRVSSIVRYDGAGTFYSNPTSAKGNGLMTRERIERWSNGSVGLRAALTSSPP